MATKLAGLLFLVTALVALGSGCGGDRQDAREVPGRLLVAQTVDLTGPIPIEGAYSYVRVEKDGDPIVEKRLDDEKTAITIAAGSYRMITYQRTCDGNCGTLDEPSDRCGENFKIDDGEVTLAHVRVTYGSGCTIRFTSA
jgi:hypothetical protein